MRAALNCSRWICLSAPAMLSNCFATQRSHAASSPALMALGACGRSRGDGVFWETSSQKGFFAILATFPRPTEGLPSASLGFNSRGFTLTASFVTRSVTTTRLFWCAGCLNAAGGCSPVNFLYFTPLVPSGSLTPGRTHPAQFNGELVLPPRFSPHSPAVRNTRGSVSLTLPPLFLPEQILLVRQ